jgi:hypothetical protein
MNVCSVCGNVYDGSFCRYGCSPANAEADAQRVLDIAYGRIDLEATHNFGNPLGDGVWRRSTDPDTLESDLDDGMQSYVRAPELSLRNLPPEWEVQRGTWESGRYRK